MSDLHAFAHWLKQRRKQLGLTQGALARQVGCATITIQKLEAGALRPSAQVAERLADQLGLAAEERLAFLASARLPATPPQGQRRLELPVAPTPLIGRSPFVAAVCATLRRPEVRLVTLSGPPGVGKTRVALQVAHELASAFQGRTSFIPLAAVTDPGAVLGRIAQAMELPEPTSQSALAQLSAVLGSSEQLLVLDNFEQVLAAAPDISALLAAAPALTVLVTSRAALHISGEHVLTVPPLALPDLADLPGVDQLARVPAVALFVQRVQAILPEFVLTAANSADVAAICQRLDGLPLALELAATRCMIFSPEALLARLQHPLALLTLGARNLPAHQQTLRNTLAWSYNLLPAAAQALFARLGVFVGGFTLEAAVMVCGDQALSPSDSLDSFELLVEQSLVQQEARSGDDVRFRLLETVRDFARELLAGRHEAAQLRERHAGYYLELAERAEPELHGPQQVPWYRRLEFEHDNIRAALSWALEHNAAELGLRLASALSWFWPTYGYVREASQWYQRLLPLIQEVPPSVQSRALQGAAALAWYQGEFDKGSALAQQVVSLRDAGGDKHAVALSLIVLSVLAAYQGRPHDASAYHQESLALFRALDAPWGLAVALGSQGIATFNLSQFDRAEACLRESLSYSQMIGDRWRLMYASTYLGLTLLLKGDHRSAEQVLADGLRQTLALGRRVIVPESFEGLSMAAASSGQIERAVQLAGAAEALREVVGSMPSPTVQSIRESYLAQASCDLGAPAFARLYNRGKAMSLSQAIQFALSNSTAS